MVKVSLLTISSPYDCMGLQFEAGLGEQEAPTLLFAFVSADAQHVQRKKLLKLLAASSRVDLDADLLGLV